MSLSVWLNGTAEAALMAGTACMYVHVCMHACMYVCVYACICVCVCL